MHERIEHGIDHAEMIRAGELLLHVHEIFVHRVQAAREQLAKVQRRVGIALQESVRVADDVKGASLRRAHRRRMRFAEQGGKIAKDRARLGRSRHGHSILQHFHRAFAQKEDQPSGSALLDDHFARRKVPNRVFAQRIEDRGHGEDFHTASECAA